MCTTFGLSDHHFGLIPLLIYFPPKYLPVPSQVQPPESVSGQMITKLTVTEFASKQDSENENELMSCLCACMFIKKLDRVYNPEISLNPGYPYIIFYPKVITYIHALSKHFRTLLLTEHIYNGSRV